MIFEFVRLSSLRAFFTLLVLMICASGRAQSSAYYEHNESATYYQAIAAYKALAEKYEEARLTTQAKTDCGKPLHLFVIDTKQQFKSKLTKRSSRMVILINNAIHPGEPCGIDASIKLATDLLEKPEYDSLLERCVICIIPVYNIGGALNRGVSRVNQNGPKAYGFRGNYQHLDLNRDFIKMDSKNMKGMARIFQAWNPSIYIETHTTNGYQYQYSLGLIPTQPDKLGGECGKILRNEMLPEIYKRMSSIGKEITPYVYTRDGTPHRSIMDFMETPRYSTGYAALFQTIGFITEAHKFKPFKDRVEHTYHTMLSIIKSANKRRDEIIRARKLDRNSLRKAKEAHLAWVIDSTRTDPLKFKGYAFGETKSGLSDVKYTQYDLLNPRSYNLKHYTYFKPSKTVKIPEAYVIPQAYARVITNLRMNRVRMKKLKRDSVMELSVYYIDKYETVPTPFEKHYLHYNTKVREEKQIIELFAGDMIVPTDQDKIRFVMETLEPEAPDSYFNWNFFDNVLQRKEGFSHYAFDSTATRMIAQDPKLKKDFDAQMKSDSTFASSHWRQLNFIYERSRYMDKAYMRYPIFRISRK